MNNFYKNMQKRFANESFLPEIENFINENNDDEIRKYLSFLYLNMPISDVLNVKKGDILDFAIHAKYLRENRCRYLDEDIFLNYVLFHRINDEEIIANRSFFYDKIKDLLTDNIMDDIIKINYWCSSMVTYRSTDDRTRNVINIFDTGFGRCGEESSFVISVLRAAGIAARQVYSVWWSHCDDNHAWVEVYIDGAWHYLGACEAEEILDKAWFDDASARAMLIRSRLFSSDNKSINNLISVNDTLCEINQTFRYADTKNIKIILRKSFSKLKNINFDICVMNYAGFLPIVSAKTDEEGEYNIDLGLGTIFISLYIEDNYIIPINTYENIIFDIDIDKYKLEFDKYKEINIYAPKASDRNRKKAPKKKEYNYKEKRFINIPLDILKKESLYELWKTLCEKDKLDISFEILKDCYDITNINNVNHDIYIKYIQNPRVAFEQLSPCRKIFQKSFKNILDIINFIKSVRINKDIFITNSLAVYRYKICSIESLRIFIVNVFRSLSIPSKLENNLIYIYENKKFTISFELENAIQSLIYKKEAKRELSLSSLYIEEDVKLYLKKFALARYDRYLQQMKVLDFIYQGENILPSFDDYILTTANRLPNGNIFAKYKLLRLEKNKKYKLDIKYKKADIKDLTSNISLIDDIKEKCILDEGKFNLLVFLEEEKEPSQHIANDLLEQEYLLEKLVIKLFFVDKFKNKDYAINKLIERAKQIEIINNMGEAVKEIFGRSIFVNHETLPIVALCKDDKVVYAFSGYQVGSGDMIEKIIKSLRNSNKE